MQQLSGPRVFLHSTSGPVACAPRALHAGAKCNIVSARQHRLCVSGQAALDGPGSVSCPPPPAQRLPAFSEHDTAQPESHESSSSIARSYVPRDAAFPLLASSRRESIPALSVTVVADRAPPPVPEPVPVLHSSAYLRTSYTSSLSMDDAGSSSSSQETGQLLAASQAAADMPSSSLIARPSRSPSPYYSGAQGGGDVFTGSALEWMLSKADSSLDEIEHNPAPLQKAVYSISRGPVGTATSSAVQAAARLTVQATVQAAKVAAPFGRWALSEGTKAAANLIKAAVVEGVRSEARRASGTKVIKGGSSSSSSQQQQKRR